MRRIFGAFVIAGFLMGAFAFVPTIQIALAAETAPLCDCWCGKDRLGAYNWGNQTEKECRTFCGELNQTDFIQCVEKGISGTHPRTNLKCWSKSECEKVDPDTGQPGGAWWDTQGADCLPNFRYCKSVQPPVPLSVHIGETEIVLGIGGYIAAVYKWLMGAAAVFAVLMFTVGALMYMLSAGKSDLLGKGKEHMKNALIGFVLLLATFLILQTVNPQTLSLQPPSVPKVRSLPFSQGEQGCEAYYEGGYTLEETTGNNKYQKDSENDGSPYNITSTGTCGKKMEVIKLPNGGDLMTPTECYFQTGQCKAPTARDAGEVCVFNTGGAREGIGTCRSCVNVDATEGGYARTYATPRSSSALCSTLSQPEGFVADASTINREICYFQPNVDGVSFHADTCVSIGLNCSSVSSCEDYLNVPLAPAGAKIKRFSEKGNNEALIQLCKTNDPCRIGPCRISAVGLKNTCTKVE
ncbi:MAG: pilin [bacterium]|nr:pilin [bacterium]